MSIVNLHRKKIIYCLLALIILLFFWLSSGDQGTSKIQKIQDYQHKKKDINNLSKKWILEYCLKEDFNKMSLEYLPEYMERFYSSSIKDCNFIGQVFNSMFELEKVVSDVRLTPEFSKRVLGWLGNSTKYLEQAHHQVVIKLYNKYVSEEMIFNPLRGKRPIKAPEVSDKKFSLDMIEASKNTCDFCNQYKKSTADDVFDKIETNLSYTSANTFKYDKWHGLILSRNHNPVALSKPEFLDMFNTAILWFKKVRTLDNNALHPAVLWDVMPKSGASQVHPHFQLSIGPKNYGGMRRWLEASKHYYNKNNRNFYEDFILIHRALGLTYRYKNAVIIANLIPIKEQEFYLIAENSESGYKNLATLLHKTIKIMVDDYENYAWSMAMFLPKYEGSQSKFFTEKTTCENDGDLNRIVLRIVFRTPAAAMRSDYNGLDMYTSSVLGIDRYKIANNLFSKLEAKIGQ